jgi:hypothetical protein
MQPKNYIIPGGKWYASHRADPRARPLADRHYNRQKIGAPQFAPPGSCIVLLADGADGEPAALWITSVPIAAYVRHAWAGAWVCSCFRNEGVPGVRSSDLIRQAVAIKRLVYGPPPEQGFITFVDRDKTLPKLKPGWCYRKAGWRHVGETAGGLAALQLLPGAIFDGTQHFGMLKLSKGAASWRAPESSASAP